MLRRTGVDKNIMFLIYNGYPASAGFIGRHFVMQGFPGIRMQRIDKIDDGGKSIFSDLRYSAGTHRGLARGYDDER